MLTTDEIDGVKRIGLRNDSSYAAGRIGADRGNECVAPSVS